MASLLWLLLLTLGVATQASVIIKNSWYGGFEAVIKLRTTSRTSGWRVAMVFSKPVTDLQVWSADVEGISDGNTKYILVNKGWNRKLRKGQLLKFNFLGKISDGNPPTALAAFVGEDMPSLPKTTTTTTRTTSATTASTTATTATTTTAASLSPTKPPPTHLPPTSMYNYKDALHKSILFYEAQRSGKLPAGNRVPWRGDSALLDGSNVGHDLTGGWYDAGDFVKFNFPMASSVTVLAWGVLQFREGYVRAAELENVLDSIRWPLDYFIKCHTANNELYGQVGDGNVDHGYWGRPEDMTMARPAWKIDSGKPGSDLAAETAAAMAAGSIVYKTEDPAYSDNLLRHAKTLYEFAYNHRGKYSDSIPNAAPFYKSYSGYKDELAWGALWLWKATGNTDYIRKAEEFYTNSHPPFFSWDDKTPGVMVLLYEADGSETYANDLRQFLQKWFPGGSMPYTPKGLAWGAQWGPNRYAANAALIALMAADQGILPAAGRKFARAQIDYMLGGAGRSFVVGFGHNPPTHPHHASSSCPDPPASCGWTVFNSPAPNAHVLYGALVGGPDKLDNYVDDRKDYVKNEVTCDYNAGYQSVLAGLLKLEDVASLVTDTPTTVSRPSTMSTTSEGCTCVCPSTP